MTSVNRSRIKQEIGLIPTWAYIVAACVFVAIPTFFLTFVWGTEPGEGRPFFVFIFPFIPAVLLAFLTLMIGYVNRDAGRRGMSRTLWTLIVIFVPNAIGFIIYFLLRNPVQTNCPKCGFTSDSRANYCPRCRHSFHPTCPQCKAAFRPADSFCANCGYDVKASIA